MKLKQSLVTAAIAALLCAASSTLMAQPNGGGGAGGGNAGGGGRRGQGGGGGNFDPAQFQQQRLDRIREQMEVKGDDEWKAILDRVQKVFDAQTAVAGFRSRGGRGGGPGGGGGNVGGGGNAPGGGRGGFGGEPAPELDALQKAITDNAPADQIKAALAKFRAARKAKEDALAKAQTDLQKVLTPKQEATAVTVGLLN